MHNWINTYIGKKIFEYRKESGISQEALGKDLDLSRTSIANYEAGTQSIAIADLFKIAIIFKKDISIFLPAMSDVKNLMKTPVQKILEDNKLPTEIKEELTLFLKRIKLEKE